MVSVMSTGQTSAYQYQPLETSTPHVRLITILPRGVDLHINIAIEHVSLAEVNNEYDAISYTWGSNQLVRPVWVDGQLLWLRKNIWDFLNFYYKIQDSQSPHQDHKRWHRHPTDLVDGRPPKFWIDSISINQDNAVEKSEQVSMMGKIFSSACRVLVWQGKDISGTSMIARNLVDHLVPKDYSSLDKRAFYDEGHIDLYFQTRLPRNDVVSHEHALCRDVVDICNSEYWKRLWIVQELSLAKHAYVILGHCLLEVDYLDAMARAFIGSARPDSRKKRLAELGWSIRGDNRLIYRQITKFRETTRWKPNEPLEDLLATYHEQLCADPRDRIFGLLGLIGRSIFDVDYTQTREEVLIALLRRKYPADRTYQPPKTNAKDFKYMMKALEVSYESLMKQMHVSSSRIYDGVADHICSLTIYPDQCLVPKDCLLQSPKRPVSVIIIERDSSGTEYSVCDQNLFVSIDSNDQDPTTVSNDPASHLWTMKTLDGHLKLLFRLSSADSSSPRLSLEGVFDQPGHLDYFVLQPAEQTSSSLSSRLNDVDTAHFQRITPSATVDTRTKKFRVSSLWDSGGFANLQHPHFHVARDNPFFIVPLPVLDVVALMDAQLRLEVSARDLFNTLLVLDRPYGPKGRTSKKHEEHGSAAAD